MNCLDLLMTINIKVKVLVGMSDFRFAFLVGFNFGQPFKETAVVAVFVHKFNVLVDPYGIEGSLKLKLHLSLGGVIAIVVVDLIEKRWK